MQDEPLITYPLRRLLKELLKGQQNTDVEMELAKIIYGHLQNKSTAFIQFSILDDPRAVNPQEHILERPLLWDYAAYMNSSDLWRRQKDYSHKDRVKVWLREANIKIAIRAIKLSLDFDDEKASSFAYKLVTMNKKHQLRALGMTKFLTREEEL